MSRPEQGDDPSVTILLVGGPNDGTEMLVPEWRSVWLMPYDTGPDGPPHSQAAVYEQVFEQGNLSTDELGRYRFEYKGIH